MDKLSYHRHRFPVEVTHYAVRLYFRFPLSYRDVEDIAPATIVTDKLSHCDNANDG